MTTAGIDGSARTTGRLRDGGTEASDTDAASEARRPRRFTRDAAALVGLGIFAVAIELHYGRRGFMPIDQSVVFDGGWRTLSGQIPFRDYTTPNAIVPSLIQGLFFWAFGVSWTVYLVHAAVFNALFAGLVYVLLRLCGGDRLTASLYGGLSAVVFYPPVGAPFHDQHAFFFALLAIVLAVAGRRSGRGATWGPQALWFAVPFALVASALSKQTPAVLAAPIVLALALAPGSSTRRALAWLVAGSLASLALVVAAASVAGVDWNLVRVYFLDLPLATGRARGKEVVAQVSGLIALAAVFVVSVVVPTLAWRWLRRAPLRLGRGVALPLALSAALLLVCASFISHTANDPAEGMPFLFASIGLYQVAVVRSVPSWKLVRSVSLKAAAGAAASVAAIALAWTFNSEVNETRLVANVDYDAANVETAVPPAMSFIRFQVPGNYAGLRAADLSAVVSYLAARPGNFVLLGDTTILSGLTGKPSVFPALFLAKDLTIPKPGSAELTAFEQRLLDRVNRMDVRRVVLERRTWDRVTLDDFPRFRSFVRRCTESSRTVGAFRIVELATRPGCGGSSE